MTFNSIMQEAFGGERATRFQVVYRPPQGATQTLADNFATREGAAFWAAKYAHDHDDGKYLTIREYEL